MKDTAFKSFQKPFLSILNTSYGRKYFGIDHHLKSTQKIVLVSPNSFAYLDGDTIHQIFRCYDLFGHKVSKLIKYGAMGTASFLSSGTAAPMFMTVLATESYFAGAGDGFVNRTSEANWAAAHDAADGDAADATDIKVRIVAQPAADGGWRIDRGFFPFDTSAIPDSVTITSGSFNGMVKSIRDEVGGALAVLDLITTTQADTATLGTADFDQVGTTLQATSVSISALTDETYFAMTLNAAGLASVSKTGFTKFGIRDGHDTANTAMSDAATNTDLVDIASSEASGTSEDPYLTISYPTDSALPLMFSGGGYALG